MTVESGPSASGMTLSRSPLQRAARGGVLNLATSVISAIATFGLTIAVTRALTLNVAGVFFATSSVFVLLSSIGRLGTDSSLVYFLSRCRALGLQGQVTSYVRAALRPVTAVGIGMGLALFIGAPTVARWTAADEVPLATTYLRVFAAVIPFASVEYVLLSASRGMGTMRPSAVVEQLVRPLCQLLFVVVVVMLPSVTLLPWAWGLAYGAAALLAALWWRRLRQVRALRSERHAVGRAFWRFSTPRSLTSAAQVGMQRLDIVLVAALAGVGPAAVYTATTRFIVLGQMARNAVSQSVQPPLAEALARRDLAAANHLYQTSTAWLIMTSWPLYLILGIAGGPMLDVFGRQYQDGAQILLILSIGMLVAIACGDVDIVLIMAGRPTWSMWNVLLAFGSNIALDLWLIPLHGVTGAAVGWAIAMVIKNGTAVVQVALFIKLHPLGRTSIAALVCTLLAFAAIPIGLRWAGISETERLLLSVVLGVLVYGAMLWRFRGVLELTHVAAGFRSRRARAAGDVRSA